MVPDMACQKTVRGREWLQKHTELLKDQGLTVRTSPGSNYFLYGSGPRIRSTAVKEIPAGIGSVAGIVRSAEVDTHVPLLGRRYIMTQLGTILDLVGFKAHFKNIDMTIPLVKLADGHLAVSIVEWPVSRFPRRWLDPSSDPFVSPEVPHEAHTVHLPDLDASKEPGASAPSHPDALDARWHHEDPQSQTMRAPRRSILVKQTSSDLREHDSVRPAMAAPMAPRGGEGDEAFADGPGEPREFGIARPLPRGRDADDERGPRWNHDELHGAESEAGGEAGARHQPGHVRPP